MSFRFTSSMRIRGKYSSDSDQTVQDVRLQSVSSTEVYTKVFALDVAARHRVQFLMPGDDAVAMLRGNT